MTPPAASPPAAAVAHSALALAAHRERQQRCGGPTVVWVPYVDPLADKASLKPFVEREDGLILTLTLTLTPTRRA